MAVETGASRAKEVRRGWRLLSSAATIDNPRIISKKLLKEEGKRDFLELSPEERRKHWEEVNKASGHERYSDIKREEKRSRVN